MFIIVFQFRLCLLEMAQWVNNLPANAGDTGDAASVTGLGRAPGEGNGNPLHYSCPGKYRRQRSLVGYSPWGLKESNANRHTHVYQIECYLDSVAKPVSVLRYNNNNP